jgi:hypothetical protein
MGNSAKSQFYSVLSNKFHHRTNLIAVLFRNLVFQRQLRTQNFEIFSPEGTAHKIPTPNGKMKVLLNEFHHRTNLTTLLLSNFGSESKLNAENFEICKS